MKKYVAAGLLALALPAAVNASVGFTGHFTSADQNFYVGEEFGGILNGNVLGSYFIGDEVFNDGGPSFDYTIGDTEYVGYGHRADYDHDVTLSFNTYSGSDQQLVGTTGSFSYSTETIFEGDGDGVATFSANAPTFPGETAPAVPEAATWFMMILGFGVIGGVMRRAHRNSEERFTRKVRKIAAA